MDTVFNSIDDICDLTIAWFNQSPDGDDYYYFSEQSSLQVLRELPIDTDIKVTDIFSERHRIFQKTDTIKTAKTVGQFLDVVLPLVEHGNFSCKEITIIIDNQIKLDSHDDGEVHLVSSNTHLLQNLISKILTRQHYDPKLLTDIIGRPNLYHKLERPNRILSSYATFDEVIEAI